MSVLNRLNFVPFYGGICQVYLQLALEILFVFQSSLELSIFCVNILVLNSHIMKEIDDREQSNRGGGGWYFYCGNTSNSSLILIVLNLSFPSSRFRRHEVRSLPFAVEKGNILHQSSLLVVKLQAGHVHSRGHISFLVDFCQVKLNTYRTFPFVFIQRFPLVF